MFCGFEEYCSTSSSKKRGVVQNNVANDVKTATEAHLSSIIKQAESLSCIGLSSKKGALVNDLKSLPTTAMNSITSAGKIDALEVALSNTTKQLSTKTSELDLANKRVIELTNEKTSLQNSIKELSSQLAASQQRDFTIERTNLQQRIAELEDNVSNLSSQLARAEQNVIDLTTQRANLQRVNDELTINN